MILHWLIPGFRSWWKEFKAFCLRMKYIKSESELDQLINAKTYPADVTVWIALWIMDKYSIVFLHLWHPCSWSYRADEYNVKTGARKKTKPASYSTAQKMRASISHQWSRVFGVGMTAWGEHPNIPGAHIGNPSMSILVSQYMISLRRRKVCPLGLRLRYISHYYHCSTRSRAARR